MKTSLILKPDIKFKQDYNSNQELSLHILSMNKTDLGRFLKEKSYQNPFLIMQAPSEEMIDFQVQKETLSDIIISQLMYLKEKVSENLVYYLISYLDSNGYFKCTFDELVRYGIYSKEELEKNIKLLQTLDPAGCFCFSLQESLKVQSEISDWPASETAYILCDYLEELAQKKYDKIMHECNLTYDEIEEGFNFIKHLNPKPASQYSVNSVYLQPEAKIIVEEKEIRIVLLNEDLSLEFNEISAANLTKELKQLRNQAKNIMNFVQKRSMTMIQILQIVCEKQKEYFIHGKPLCRCTMEEVASLCGLHVSTVSRAIQDKTIEFNDTYIPIRSLFVRKGKKEFEINDIVNQMKLWIQQEDCENPMSDEKLRKEFQKQGVEISRRTIAKYRAIANIKNAQQRKKVSYE